MFYNNRNKKKFWSTMEMSKQKSSFTFISKKLDMQRTKKQQDKLFFITFFLAIHSSDELKQLPDEAVSHKKRSEDTSKQEGVASCPGQRIIINDHRCGSEKLAEDSDGDFGNRNNIQLVAYSIIIKYTCQLRDEVGVAERYFTA